MAKMAIITKCSSDECGWKIGAYICRHPKWKGNELDGRRIIESPLWQNNIIPKWCPLADVETDLDPSTIKVVNGII